MNPKRTLKKRKHRSSRKRREEAECLLTQVAKTAEKRTKPGGRESSVGVRELGDSIELKCFLEHRFKEPLLTYGGRGPAYGRAFTFLSVAVVAAGFGSSAISVAQQQDSPAGSLTWIVFGLGVVVSLFTAVNQLWKPDLRSVSSYRAGNALRREGWDFVFGRGRYQSAKEGEAFDRFVDKILEIQSQVDSIDEVQAEVNSGPEDNPPDTEKGGWRGLLGLSE